MTRIVREAIALGGIVVGEVSKALERASSWLFVIAAAKPDIAGFALPGREAEKEAFAAYLQTIGERERAAATLARSLGFPANNVPLATGTQPTARCEALTKNVRCRLQEGHEGRCDMGAPLPTPKSEFEAARPLTLPNSCPKCRGKIALYEGGEMVVSGIPHGIGVREWRCIGVPDETWARAMLAPSCILVSGEPSAEDVQIALARAPCGWSGADAERGKTWA